jgi:hypothetical protein
MDNNNGQCGVDGSFYRKINFWELLMQLWRTLSLFSVAFYTHSSKIIPGLLKNYWFPTWNHTKKLFFYYKTVFSE